MYLHAESDRCRLLRYDRKYQKCAFERRSPAPLAEAAEAACQEQVDVAQGIVSDYEISDQAERRACRRALRLAPACQYIQPMDIIVASYSVAKQKVA